MPRDNNICIWRMFFMSVVVTVWGSVGMFFVLAVIVKNRDFLALGC